MRHPKPFTQDGNWLVDLRAWSPTGRKFGRHYKLGPVAGPEALTELEASNLAWAKLFKLQAEAADAPSGPQLQLPPVARRGPATLAGAIDAWLPTKRWKDKPGSIKWGQDNAGWLSKELGAIRLEEICAPGGEARLRQYARDLESGAFAGFRYGARTIRNRFSILRMVLHFCTGDERGWLSYVPALPELPRKPGPKFDWIGESVFRFVRARIYADSSDAHLRSVMRREDLGDDPKLYVARRRLYMSWLFYTGARTHDADELTADDVGLDVGVYIRHGRKTGIPLEQFELPTPLADDLRAYLKLAGRAYFLPAEPIGGGVWTTTARVMRETAALHKVHNALNPRLLRRSYARRMFELGYQIKDVADRMGHIDTRMLHEVYARTPRPTGRASTKWPRFRDDGRTPADEAPSKVLAFGKSGDNDDSEGGDDNGNE